MKNVKKNDWVVYNTTDGLRSGIVQKINRKDKRAIVKLDGEKNTRDISFSRLRLFVDV